MTIFAFAFIAFCFYCSQIVQNWSVFLIRVQKCGFLQNNVAFYAKMLIFSNLTLFLGIRFCL